MSPKRKSRRAFKAIVNNQRRHLERLIFLPVLVALVLIWAGLVEFALAERRSALDHVQSQLGSTVSTLADFNELADQSGANTGARTNATRTAAFWRALVQYPTASFWVESRGSIVAGQPPAGGIGASIVAQDARGVITVHAALPEADALTEWKRATWQSVAALSVVTLAFLILTRFLTGALRQRAAAEREAAASAERATQLALYRTQLEATVARRTEELAQANSDLEIELAERTAAQGALREHDALLNAVTESAAKLLGSQSHEDAIAKVLELIGKTVSVSRVQSTKIDADRNGHFRTFLQHEWCAPGIPSMIDNPVFQDVDLTSGFPELIDRLLAGGMASFYADEIAMPYRTLCERAGIQSILHIPILVANALWGSLNFIDSSDTRREWSWAETDTLKTLAGLVGIAITRARYVKELADANTIVQNSPTILYRLRGEPAFPLMYVSNNIAKFGHDPATLMRSPDWARILVDSRDRPTVDAAMARMLERGADGDSIEFRLRTGGGDERWVENRYSPRRDKDGRLLEVEGIIIDITERKAAEEKIALLARTDSLTGLANRPNFLERLRQAFAATARGPRPFAILYLDLDYFKPVNDTLGHAAGDQLLRQVAGRLIKCTRGTDLVARLGGDEFAVLQADVAEPASAGLLAARIQRSLALPYLINGSEVRISASIGICPHSSSSSGPDAMLAQADLALYRSKEEGRNQYRFYSDDLDRQVLGRVKLAEDLRKALDDGELELYCEPQVELTTGEFVDMKALVRWHHPTRGLLNPADFIPILEKTASGIALGQWLLDKACQDLCARRSAGSALPVVAIDIRFSQLKNGDELVRGVLETLAKWDLAPCDLELDVTEETLAQATLTQNDTLRRLHELGVRIAIADFGTKCSSFGYLRAYWISRIKLSQSFISGAFAQPDRAATIQTVVQFARETGVGLITHGLETEEQRALLLSPRSLVRGHDVAAADPACLATAT
jgi:diguanylate cyclase (GGDEF)-like protein/PAS domain S-box-containing protein